MTEHNNSSSSNCGGGGKSNGNDAAKKADVGKAENELLLQLVILLAKG